jgi:GAF domain-containing protein
MKTHFSHTLINALLRLADAPEQTLSKMTARFSGGSAAEPASGSTPDHVMRRLESVFEAMSELSFQPDIAAALDLACDTLQAELPTAAVAAGVYDINSDEMRIVAARGLECDLVRGTLMPRARCFAGQSAEVAVVVSGATGGADWLGTVEAGSTVLLCPILNDANLLGVVALADPQCSAEFDHHDVELVSYVASQLAGFMQARRVSPSLAAPAAAKTR